MKIAFKVFGTFVGILLLSNVIVMAVEHFVGRISGSSLLIVCIAVHTAGKAYFKYHRSEPAPLSLHGYVAAMFLFLVIPGWALMKLISIASNELSVLGGSHLMPLWLGLLAILYKIMQYFFLRGVRDAQKANAVAA